MNDHVDGGDKGERGHDHLVARPDAQRLEDKEAARRPGRDADSVLGAAHRGEALFELAQLRAADDPAAADHGGGCRLLLASEERPAEGYAAHAAPACWYRGIVQFSTRSSSSADGSGWRRRNQCDVALDPRFERDLGAIADQLRGAPGVGAQDMHVARPRPVQLDRTDHCARRPSSPSPRPPGWSSCAHRRC